MQVPVGFTDQRLARIRFSVKKEDIDNISQRFTMSALAEGHRTYRIAVAMRDDLECQEAEGIGKQEHD
jgi:hypothetical protein